MSTLKVLLNIALWILVVSAKTSSAEHYSNILSKVYKKTSSHDRPLVMVVDENSKHHDKNDHHMTYSQRGDQNNMDDSADSANMSDDVPYPFLYLYKLVQQMKNKLDKQNKNSKHGSSFSSMSTNRRPSYQNRDHRNSRWSNDRTAQYNERDNQGNYRHNHKYEGNDYRHSHEDNNYSHRNHGYNGMDSNHKNDRYRHDHRYHRHDDDGHGGMSYNNRFDGDKRHYHENSNRYHNNVDRYENEHDNRFQNKHNNRYRSAHERYHSGRYRDMHNNHVDNSRLTNEDKEILKLQQNIVKSPLVKTLLGITNSLRQRKPKVSCESGDTCEDSKTADKNVTDDPCEENSNSCGEDEDDKNPSTRGAAQGYVSDPPPKIC